VVFWDVTPCSLVRRHQHFGRTYCFCPINVVPHTRLHGITNQKPTIRIFTAAKTWISENCRWTQHFLQGTRKNIKNIGTLLWSVTMNIDGFWIDDRIYWTLRYSVWLHFTIHYYTHAHTTSVHSHVFISRCSVATSNGRRSPSSGFPTYPGPQLPVSHSKQLITTEPQQFSNSLTDSRTN
jgi:hypothetical protein